MEYQSILGIQVCSAVLVPTETADGSLKAASSTDGRLGLLAAAGARSEHLVCDAQLFEQTPGRRPCLFESCFGRCAFHTEVWVMVQVLAKKRVAIGDVSTCVQDVVMPKDIHIPVRGEDGEGVEDVSHEHCAVTNLYFLTLAWGPARTFVFVLEVEMDLAQVEIFDLCLCLLELRFFCRCKNGHFSSLFGYKAILGKV